MKKKIHIISLAQVALGALTIVAVLAESFLWWLPGVPWIIISIIGIVLTIPLFIVIGIGAGCAQADWMSDGFIITLCFIIPTSLAVGANYCHAALAKRKTQKEPDGSGEQINSGDSLKAAPD